MVLAHVPKSVVAMSNVFVAVSSKFAFVTMNAYFKPTFAWEMVVQVFDG